MAKNQCKIVSGHFCSVYNSRSIEMMESCISTAFLSPQNELYDDRLALALSSPMKKPKLEPIPPVITPPPLKPHRKTVRSPPPTPNYPERKPKTPSDGAPVHRGRGRPRSASIQSNPSPPKKAPTPKRAAPAAPVRSPPTPLRSEPPAKMRRRMINTAGGPDLFCICKQPYDDTKLVHWFKPACYHHPTCQGTGNFLITGNLTLILAN